MPNVSYCQSFGKMNSRPRYKQGMLMKVEELKYYRRPLGELVSSMPISVMIIAILCFLKKGNVVLTLQKINSYE